MNKKLVVVVLASVVTLLNTSPVFAKENGNSKLGLESRKSKIEQKIVERDEKKVEKQERRDQWAETRAKRVSERFTQDAQRLQATITKLSDQIVKKQTAGKDMTLAKTNLETAKTSLATAIGLGNQAVAKLKAVETKPWDIQKPEIKAAQEAVKAAQASFVQVIKNIRITQQSIKAVK